MKKLLLLVCALLMQLPAMAFDIDIIGYSIVGNEAVVEGFADKDFIAIPDEIVIPEQIEYDNQTYKVVKINDYAFSGALIKSIHLPESLRIIGEGAFSESGLTSINLPEGLWSIGEGAFSGTYLTSIILPEGFSSISSGVFSDCTSLTSIKIPESVGFIGDSAFSNCKSLTSIKIPENVTYIGTWAFSGCTSLTSINLPEGVDDINNYTFYNCTSLTSIEIPESVTYIGQKAFSRSGLTSIEIPESVTRITYDAFHDCTSLTSIILHENITSLSPFEGCSGLKSIDIPGSVVKIDKSFFEGYSHLTSVILNEGTEEIEEAAFKNCEALTSVILPEGLTKIGKSAFENCNNLFSVNIPASVSYIGDRAFCGNKIQTVVLNWETPLQFHALPGFGGVTIPAPDPFYWGDTRALVVPEGRAKVYARADYWKEWKNILEMPEDGELEYVDPDSDIHYFRYSDTQAVPMAHTDLSGDVAVLPEVTISGKKYTVDAIAGQAFSNCNELNSVTLPQTINLIDGGAFSDSNISSIVIPASVTSIEYLAFQNCWSLKTIYSESSVPPTLGEKVFHGRDTYKIVLYVPMDAYDAYLEADQWKDFIDTRDVLYIKDNGITYVATGGSSNKAEIIAADPTLEEFIINNSVEDKATRADGTVYEVRSIAENAFLSCKNIKRIVCTSETPVECKGTCFNQETYDNCELIVPDEAIDTYKAADGWMNFVNIKKASEAGIKVVEAAEEVNIIVSGRAVTATADTTITIYSIDGTTVANRKLAAGESIEIPAGIYIVVANGNCLKTVVR